jgi:hypothetical protein
MLFAKYRNIFGNARHKFRARKAGAYNAESEQLFLLFGVRFDGGKPEAVVYPVLSFIASSYDQRVYACLSAPGML